MEKGKSKIHKPLKGTVFLLRDFTTQLTKNYIKKDLSIKFNDNRIRNCTERERDNRIGRKIYQFVSHVVRENNSITKTRISSMLVAGLADENAN